MLDDSRLLNAIFLMLEADDLGEVFLGDCTLTLSWLRSLGMSVSLSILGISTMTSSRIMRSMGDGNTERCVISNPSESAYRAVKAGTLAYNRLSYIWVSTSWKMRAMMV